MMRFFTILVVCACFSSAGCVPVYPDSRSVATATNSSLKFGEQYNAAKTGQISGKVSWSGEVPKLAPVMGAVPAEPGKYQFRSFPAPFAPQVTANAVAGVLVELRGIDPTQAKPWDLPPVQIVWRDGQLFVNQFDWSVKNIGIVQRGAEVSIIAEDSIPHTLRGRGADFFALPLPVPSQPKNRTFNRPGIVELTSGMGYFWATADLLVVDHPYYAITNSEGRFGLKNVPEGKYELRFRMRRWNVTGQERDPETGLIFRQNYAPAMEKSLTVQARTGQASEVQLGFSAEP